MKTETYGKRPRGHRLDKSREYIVHKWRKVTYHPDLGWGIYVRRKIGGDWDRETDLTEDEAWWEVQP